ncbi:hypothetical protein K2P96_00805 [Patescibacteria group bacterium]|nr:hypothetical protein [Patescibacteria group bacterium]
MSMDEKLAKCLCGIKCTPSADLAEHIWHHLRERNKRIARIETCAYSLIGIISVFSLIPAIKMLSRDIYQSGFYEYTSLLFSDSRSIFSHFKEYALTLAESIPTVSIILSLSLIFIFFLSIKKATKQITRSQLSFRFGA